MKQKLFESLESKVGKDFKSRRYNLSDMISESYKTFYACQKGSNLQKLAESHIEDVRKNPTDTERLSRQLCMIKEALSLVESGKVEDEDLVPEEKYDTVEPKEERVLQDKCNESYEGDVEYGYEIWFDGNCISSDTGFEDYEEAQEEAQNEVAYIIDVEEGYEEESPEDFEVRIIEPEVSECDEPQEGKRLNDIKQSIDEADAPDLTDEEVEELAKHLEEIRKGKKSIKEDVEPEEEMEESAPARKGLKVSSKRESKRVCDNDLEESSSLQSYEIYVYGQELEGIDSEGGWQMAYRSFSQDSAEETLDTWINEIGSENVDCNWGSAKVGESKRVCESMSPEDFTKEIFAFFDKWSDYVDIENIVSAWEDYVESKDGIEESKRVRESLDMDDEELSLIRRFLEKELGHTWTDPEDEKKIRALLRRVHEYNPELFDSESMEESASYSGLANFKNLSESKAFYKTFKKLDTRLKEGTALTRQESIDLYKAANSAMTHLSVELEHNPEFLDIFKECTTLLSRDVDSILGSLKEGKGPSKKTMKSLAKFSEALLCESAELSKEELKKLSPQELKFYYKDHIDPDEYPTFIHWTKSLNLNEVEEEDLPPIEDEESEVVAPEEEEMEEPEMSEEAEEFSQEYADARQELHDELADKYADSEDPDVQEQIEADRVDVAILNGEDPYEEESTEEPVEDEEAPAEDVEEEPTEEDEEEEIEESVESDDEITPDELEELKKHLREMRSAKLRESEDLCSQVKSALDDAGISYKVRGRKGDMLIVAKKDLERASSIRNEIDPDYKVTVATPA